ncbi:SDR family NAD(P)-dependent oxidoreductase [Streptomyces endophyticus]|uniref:SDR family oxidoreductase n=1 Tax=Streptomyces endophyticus TaxID=714166 RepID=A0ABU6F3D1_9ACTN|nr:SDR family oxidoreductase [Streptomyces endophyticus]MEB8338511.1 SDR family oxidoreductase [Streptomyces endophyticus]
MTVSGTTGTALVTGASRGLGAVIARRLAAAGHPVAAVYRSDATAARSVVADIRASGGTAQAFAADVTDETAVTDLVLSVAARLGPVTTLVVNATGPQPARDPAAVSWDDHLAQLSFFVKSPTLLMQAVLPAMRERGGGRIVQIGSDVTERLLPEMSAYVAAKAAQHSLTECWARALGPHGITVNTVAPGWIPVERHTATPAGERAAYTAEVPLRRMGSPDDVAAAVAYLVSSEGAFVTGERIRVNGGHSLGG